MAELELEREQRKLAAIVAVDVVGYSRLMGRDESGTVARLRKIRGEQMGPILARHGGRIVKLTGDGAILEFSSAVEAVSAAIEFQQAMAAANLRTPPDECLVYRIGIHLGDLIVDGDDLYGDGVNVAARLEAQAPAGGIVVSAAVCDFVGERVKAHFVDLGELLLKNIERPTRAFRLNWEPADWPVMPASSSYSVLGSSSIGPALPDKPSIAVMPFANLSGDSEQEYFADGIAEEIITELSRFHSLFVIARNSSFTYKGKSIDARQAGRELGVRYVLEGSVRRAGSRVRVAARLVDAGNGSQVWSDRYDFGAEDVFDVQDEVMRKITAVLPGRLETAELAKAERKTSQSLEAWDLLLRGKYLHHLENPESNLQAETCFDQSIARDPKFAAAIAWKACTLGQAWNNEWRPRKPELFAEMNRLVQRAYELDENDAECHRIICRISLMQRLYEKSEHHLSRALQLTPNDPRLIAQRGINSTYIGESQAALPWLEQAMRVDPFSASRYETDLARALYAGKRAGEAVDVLKRTTRPNYGIFLLRAVCHVELGDHERGKSAIAEALADRPELSVGLVMERQPWKRQEDTQRMANALLRAGLPG